MSREPTRRRVIAGLALGVPLAGCLGVGSDSEPTPTGTAASTEQPSETPTASPTETTEPTETAAPTDQPTETTTATPTPAGGESAVDEYLTDTSNYDGTIADRTGRDRVRVEVGAQGNGGGFAYGPPAIRVDTGTTVVWEWTGSGGLHNVVAEDGTFNSGDPVSGSGETFRYTVEEAGTYLYFCDPHKALGMKGAVVVE